jgi:hypothetical protein
LKNYWKHIDDFFREKLGRYKEAPPADVWEALDKRLDGLAPAPVAGYRWVRHAAIIAALIVLSIPLVKKYAGHTATDAKDIAATTTAGTVSAAQATAKTTPTTIATGNTAAQQTVAAMGDAAHQSATINNNNSSNVATAATTVSNHRHTAGSTAANKYIRTTAARHSAGHKNGNTAGHNTAGANDNDVAANDHVYHSSTANPAPLDETTNDQTNLASPKQTLSSANPAKAALPGTLKKESAGNTKAAVAKKAANSNDKAGFNRFEAGIKVGFEAGFDNNASQKLVVAPYLQYNLSRKFALMVQPAVKGASTNEHSIGDSKSYYSINDDGKVVIDQVTPHGYYNGSVFDTTSYTTKYTATQSHDSLVKSYKYGGYYTQLELPILLKYQLAKRISVYGGVNILYSRTSGIIENTATTTGLTRSADAWINSPTNPYGSPLPAAQDIINYSGNSIKEYQNPYANVVKNDVRLGYMLGFTYDYSNRWLLDALIQQNPGKPQTIQGNNINAPLSATYFRLSIGYKLTK